MNHFSSVKILSQRLLIIILMFSICRILFVIFNLSYFNDLDFFAFIYGIRFDLSIITWFSMPLILLHIIPFPFRFHKYTENINKFFFHLINSFCIILNCIDIAYYSFTLKRTTSDVFSFIAFGNDLFRLLPQFLIDFWYIPLIIIFLIYLSTILYQKFISQKGPKFNYIVQFIIFFLGAGLTVISARGGFQMKPVQMIDAGRYVSPQNISIVLNTPFSFFTTLTQPSVKLPNYFSEEEVNEHFSPIQQIKTTQKFQKKNVIILIMESFGTEYLEQGYMPFLDSLTHQGLFFTNTFANGKRSIDAVPSILAGLPNLMTTSYIYSPYAGNTINSLPNILKKEGYYTAFYHGGNNGTMGFDGFCKTADIEDYIGKNEYPTQTDYDGKWGIFDEPFMQFFAKDLTKKQTPFMTTLFSLSSHHPYTIPSQHKNKFPKGTLDIHESIGYADYALKQFFKTAEKQDWFKNTLFVITADHTSQSNEKFYQNQVGMFHVPLLFYAPNDSTLKGISKKIAQQTDIFPSVLSYLNYPKKTVSFGNNLFDDKKESYHLTYHNNIFQYIDNEYIFHFDGQKALHLYLKSDSLLENNIIETEKLVAEKLTKKVKYHIQSYFNHLSQNRYFSRKENN